MQEDDEWKTSRVMIDEWTSKKSTGRDQARMMHTYMQEGGEIGGGCSLCVFVRCDVELWSPGSLWMGSSTGATVLWEWL